MGDSFFSLQYQLDNAQPTTLGMYIVLAYMTRKSKIYPQLLALGAAFYFGSVYAFGPDSSEPN